jgi:hypothetical protein
MRPSIPLLIGTLLAIASGAQAQSVATGSAPALPAQTRQAAVQSPTAVASAASVHEPKAAHAARPAHKQRTLPARDAAASVHSSPAGGASDGVLALGASDITGNKELPKVMVIVPWKDSLGAGGVIKPTDSLLDEVLQPVDRGVFQRQVRYYGQLGAASGAPTAGRVAPVGDSH